MNPKRQAWLVMSAAYLAGVAVALNQSKVPPVMEVLVAQLKIDLTMGGWLMSAFAVAGVVLGIPAALILGRLGPKTAGLVALGCTIAGSILGALAGSAAQLLVGRVIEGIGLGLIAVVSPAVISMWFAPEERGLPMGIWSSWVPVGGFVIYNLASPLTAWSGWQGLWWFGTCLALVAFAWYALVVVPPGGHAAAPRKMAWSGTQLKDMLARPGSWILALVFGAYCFAFMAYGTWAPTYLNQALGLGPEAARFIASLSSLAIVPSLILAGWVLDRTRRREVIFTAALAIAGVLLIWSYHLGDANGAVAYMVLLGLATGFVPTATFTLAPERAPSPELAGLALGLVCIGQNLGTLIGPPIVGMVVAQGQWEAGAIPQVLAMAVAVVASLALHARHNERVPAAADS